MMRTKILNDRAWAYIEDVICLLRAVQCTACIAEKAGFVKFGFGQKVGGTWAICLLTFGETSALQFRQVGLHIRGCDSVHKSRCTSCTFVKEEMHTQAWEVVSRRCKRAKPWKCFFVKRVQCGHTCGEKSQLGSERAERQLRQPKRRKNSDATEICYMANTRPKLLHYYICYIVMNCNWNLLL